VSVACPRCGSGRVSGHPNPPGPAEYMCQACHLIEEVDDHWGTWGGMPEWETWPPDRFGAVVAARPAPLRNDTLFDLVLAAPDSDPRTPTARGSSMPTGVTSNQPTTRATSSRGNSHSRVHGEPTREPIRIESSLAIATRSQPTATPGGAIHMRALLTSSPHRCVDSPSPR
jgi:hypothetical protein